MLLLAVYTQGALILLQVITALHEVGWAMQNYATVVDYDTYILGDFNTLNVDCLI